MHHLLKNWLLMVAAWVFLANFYFIITYWGYQDFVDMGELQEYQDSVFSYVEPTFFGVLFGSLFTLINHLADRGQLRRMSFTANILLKSLLYLASIPVAGFTIMSVYYLLGGITDELLQIMPNYTTSRQLISTVLYVFFCILLINFLLQVNRKFGPGNLWKFIAGKYHTPKDENRIFMFVDLKGSTTMAEQLGHNIYSQLIQDCFYELSQVVPRYKAEIYQYVGDEAVLTWPLKEGMENLNFLRVYFAFEQRLERRRKYYLARFGVFPEFKAGVEMGSVTVAEVGEIKREIAYHGDVLNTASRIQACCNQYGKQLLVSDRLQHVLGGQQEFAVQHVGKLLLRGKKQEVDILSVEQAAAARKEARPDQVAKG